MIVSFVILILLLLMFTTIEGWPETLVTVAFLSFFFVYLLRLLNIINKPFKVGRERADDDVSLFLLYEFVVHAHLADADLASAQIVEIAEHLEEHEEVAVPGEVAASQSGEDETAITDLEEVVDAGAASVQNEPESDADPER